MNPLLNHCGTLRVELRRLLAGLTGLSLFALATTAVVNRAAVVAYTPTEEAIPAPFNPLFFMEPTNEIAGIQSGRVYQSSAPALVQTPHGQSVFNDKAVLKLEKSGSGPLDYQVTFVEPGSDSPTRMPASLFVAQVGKDVTNSLPPASNEKGQVGNGFDWRPFSGGGVQQTVADTQKTFAPGAGQPEAQTVAAPAKPEGGETTVIGVATPEPVTNAPAGGPAPAPAPAAGPNPVVAAPTGPAEANNAAVTRNDFDSSNSDATASGSTLKERSRQH